MKLLALLITGIVKMPKGFLTCKEFMKLLIATKNGGKAREFQVLLGDQWTVQTLVDLPDAPEVMEDGETFEENAIKKAVAFTEGYDGVVLADDSGLEVDALDKKPGVYSARYAGENPKDDVKNLQKVLKEIKDIPAERRQARFRCVLALARWGTVIKTVEGVCEGSIALAAQGNGGFGYDPIFVPGGYDKTFGELSLEVKNGLSHRAQAIAKVLPLLRSGQGC